MAKQYKENLIYSILLWQSFGQYTEEELKNKEIPELERIFDTVE